MAKDVTLVYKQAGSSGWPNWTLQVSLDGVVVATPKMNSASDIVVTIQTTQGRHELMTA